MLNKIPGLSIAVSIVAVLWIIHIISHIFPLANFGIMPRSFIGLRGIIFAPWLHANFIHLVANTPGIFFLSWMLIIFEKDRAVAIGLLLVLLTGLGTWLIGRPALHIGASGIIYGLIGYFLTVGWFKKTFKTIIISLATLLIYSGTFWGLLPQLGFVSWEGHLAGFISGIFLAKLFNKT